MNQRTAYLLQLLEKLGTPLMQAIVESPAGPVGDAPLEQDAQTMAVLLGKTVQASIDLGHVMEMDSAQAMTDSLRVALTALVGPIIAGQYKKRGQMPDEAVVKRMVLALQAVLAFAENFTPDPQSVQRLRDLPAEGQAVDHSQTQIQYVQAFVPVVEAVSVFSFGQPEQKILMEISNRLVRKAVELRESLCAEVTDENRQKQIELAFLKNLAGLYGASHRHETEKMTGQNTETGKHESSMESVWKMFDLRVAMLETLMASFVPAVAGKGGATAGGPAPAEVMLSSGPVVPSPIIQQAPVVTPLAPVQASPLSMFSKNPEGPAGAVENSVPSVPSPVSPPVSPPAQNTGVSAASAGGGGSPLSMFAKPKVEGGPPAAPMVLSPVGDSAVPAQMSSVPVEQGLVQPQHPPVMPQVQPVASQQESPLPAQHPPAQTGSPMAFFKKKEE